MSWYLANEDGIIDQFASISGLRDLREASESQPALKDFFEVGATENITLCMAELGHVAKTARGDIASTAKGLAVLMRGQKLVGITQGFEEED